MWRQVFCCEAGAVYFSAWASADAELAMVYDPKYARNLERSKELATARKWGIALISAAVGLGFFVSEIQRIKDSHVSATSVCYLALFVLTALLLFFWIWSTQKEFDLLLRWLDPHHYEPPAGITETLLILLLAVSVVSLLFAARNPLWYSALFSAYSVANLFGVRRLNRELCEALLKSRERAVADLSDDRVAPKAKLYLQIIDQFDSYFIKRPQTGRIVLILLCSLLALVMSIGWFASGWPSLAIGAYAVYLAVLPLSELTIWCWRSARDSALRPVIAELNELIRADDESTGTKR